METNSGSLPFDHGRRYGAVSNAESSGSSTYGSTYGPAGADSKARGELERADSAVNAPTVAQQALTAAVPFAFPVELPAPPMGEFTCATTTIDPAGRLGDRSVIKSLGWHVGQPVSIVPSEGLLRIARAPEGESSVAANGYLFLPVAARRGARLRTGQRVLMAGGLDSDVLVICPLRAVGAALWSYRPDLFEAVGA